MEEINQDETLEKQVEVSSMPTRAEADEWFKKAIPVPENLFNSLSEEKTSTDLLQELKEKFQQLPSNYLTSILTNEF